MSFNGAIPGYTIYRGDVGLYDVPSFVPREGFNGEYASFDEFRNQRVNHPLLVSIGGGDGGYDNGTTPSGPIVCRSGDDGDIQLDASERGYKCIKPVASVGCPTIAGHEAIAVQYEPSTNESGSQSRAATNRNIICYYKSEAFNEVDSFKDWHAAFTSNPADSAHYLKNIQIQDEYIMPSFCAQRVTTCLPDDATGAVITECPRWTGSDVESIECRDWMGRARVGTTPATHVETAMFTYCTRPENVHSHECQCINANQDPLYTELVEFASSTGTAIPGEKGCWYAPCVFEQSHMVPFSAECTLTEITQCSSYINIYGNEGIIRQELGQTVQCGGDIPDQPTAKPSGLGAGVENWAWWVWLVIAFLGLLVIGFIGWLLLKLFRRPASATPAAPTAPAAAPEPISPYTAEGSPYYN